MTHLNAGMEKEAYDTIIGLLPELSFPTLALLVEETLKRIPSGYTLQIRPTKLSLRNLPLGNVDG